MKFASFRLDFTIEFSSIADLEVIEVKYGCCWARFMLKFEDFRLEFSVEFCSIADLKSINSWR